MTLRLATSGLTAHQRVMAGIAYLDKEHPGWRGNVNRDTLDIASNCDCAWAQGSGTRNFNAHWATSGQKLQKAADMGFYAYCHGTAGARAEYDALNAAWLNVLAEEDRVREQMTKTRIADDRRRAVAA